MIPNSAAWPAFNVENWPLDRLVPYARNARTHSEEQVDQIVASIKEWGWTNPVLVDDEGMIIAGHGRVMAAKKMGLSEVPVMVAHGWTVEQKRAYVIADNQLALNGEWDEKALAAELAELQPVMDLELIGFSEAELEKHLSGGEAGGKKKRKERSTDLAPVIQFNIVFDDELQQEQWFGFVRQLKAKYPDEETLGARLAQFLSEQASAAG